MLTNPGVVLLRLHLFGMQAFVLGRCIEVTGTGTGHKSNFLSHQIILVALDSLALCPQVGKHFVDAVLIDDAHALVGHAQPHIAFLGFDPESLELQVRQKAPTSSVFGMGNVVAALRALPGDLADLGHGL